MILLPVIIICIIALSAIIFFYAMINKHLLAQLRAKKGELKAAKEAALEALPGLNDGSVATWVINRRNMVMTFLGDFTQKSEFKKADWDIPNFRRLCHSCCLDVFDKWIGVYSHLYNPICRRMRFHLSCDGGKTFHWWELIYKLNETTSKDSKFYGIFVNVDKIKNMENEIDDMRQKMYDVELKETFLAAINHDLRTPLNAIAGFANLLSEQYDLFVEEERKQFADIVKSNSETMLKLLDDVYTLSGEDIIKVNYKMRSKSVRELIDVIYQTNKIICPSHIDFILSHPVDDHDANIYVDPKRVEQVINNFLSNSFKFTSTGSITLGWRDITDTKEIELYVSDTGIGITEENQKRIFDQFFKVNEQAHGTGLGLDSCKKIVEKQDGTIGVESTYGRGSTFYCRFKRYDEEEEN